MLRKNLLNILINQSRSISKRVQRTLLQDLDKKKGKINFNQCELLLIFNYFLEFDFKQKRNNLKLYVWGYAETGALGIEATLKKHRQTQCKFVKHPTRLSFGERFDILDMSAGYGFSVFVVKSLDDGKSLFGTGINTDSQIGFHKLGGSLHKPMEVLIYPAPIDLPKHSVDDEYPPLATKVAAGRAHTIILTKCGSIFTIGHNGYGQCGRTVIEDEEYFGKQLPHLIPHEYFSGHKIADVACGQDHSFFITDGGKIFSCGWGADGQTGLGHYNNSSTPTLIEGDIKNEKIVKVSSAADCVLALNDKAEVFGWGNSEYGQITQDGHQQVNSPRNMTTFLSGLGKITDIAAGGSSCIVLNEAGDVFVWGYGILGFGPNVDHSNIPKQIPPTLFGRNSFNKDCRVISIKSGLSHFAALNNDNDLFTWGRNKFGCLGLGHEKDQFFPFKTSIAAKVEKIECGVDHTLAICKNFTQQ